MSILDSRADERVTSEFRVLHKREFPVAAGELPRIGSAFWFVACSLLPFPFIAVWLLAEQAGQRNAPSSVIASEAVLTGALFTPLLVIGIRVLLNARRRRHAKALLWERRSRLFRFAAQNDMVYQAGCLIPPYPGVIFQRKHSRGTRRMFDRFRPTTGRLIDIGNFPGAGYLVIRLDRNIPHLVLEARDTISPFLLDPAQIMSLEGDFNTHFTLYCPREYERDALYVLTPDLMARLVDEANGCHVEIVNDLLFVYAAQPFDFLDRGTWQRIQRIVDTIGAKAVSQTHYYADSRTSNNSLDVVASGGARLHHPKWWMWIVGPSLFLGLPIVLFMLAGLLLHS